MGLPAARLLLATSVVVGGWCLVRGILFDAPGADQRARWDQPDIPVFTTDVTTRIEFFAASLVLGLATGWYVRKASGRPS